MPAKYFIDLGFQVADKRGEEAILWKKLDQTAKPPQFRKEKYIFKPIKGKVIIDLFWNTFCQTSDVEAQRVREVVAEFGNKIVLNEFSADDPEILLRFGISRKIFINGKMVKLNGEIEKDKLRHEIKNALSP